MATATTTTTDLERIGDDARMASRRLGRLSGSAKDSALASIAVELVSHEADILAANEKDMAAGRGGGLTDAVLDRLLITRETLHGMAAGVSQVQALPDPLGESFDVREAPNGLRLAKRRVPLGVVCAIYESRPNVTVDIAALCIKSGNAVILRGGKEAIHSNSTLARVIREAIDAAGLPGNAVQLIESTDRALVGRLLTMKEHIDLVVPRGGAELVRRVADEATMPAITGGIGVCHTYVDRAADVEMAVRIASNAKLSRPYVCNALDTLLVHSAIAPQLLPRIAAEWTDAGVELRCDRRALTILGGGAGEATVPASDGDWGTEFLSLTAAVKVVDSIDEALDHIDTYTSGHTEAIVTDSYAAANRFLDEVDAGVVMVNASTRFNDGGEFGLGAEVGISTNKLHARGPIGLNELTSYKWTVTGSGQVRV
jgi:glutamate-5-semialdehyde dehydrogenase